MLSSIRWRMKRPAIVAAVLVAFVGFVPNAISNDVRTCDADDFWWGDDEAKCSTQCDTKAAGICRDYFGSSCLASEGSQHDSFIFTVGEASWCVCIAECHVRVCESGCPKGDCIPDVSVDCP